MRSYLRAGSRSSASGSGTVRRGEASFIARLVTAMVLGEESIFADVRIVQRRGQGMAPSCDRVTQPLNST